MKRRNWQVLTGRWLFRHRSHMPLLFAVIFLPALAQYKRMQYSFSQQLDWQLFCLCISLLGLAVRVMTVAYISETSSGRELSDPKAEYLNTTGSYSLVRNPLYVGNMVIWLGVASMLRFWWLSLTILLISLIYYRLIIFAEEDYLTTRFGQSYLDWAQKTPALLPSLRHWTPPALSFSMAMVIRREYSGLFQIIAVFSFMNVVLNYVTQGAWVLDLLFQYLLGSITLLCGAIWIVVKRTSWLPAPIRTPSDTSVKDVERTLN